MKVSSGTLDHWLCVPYSVFIMVWACLMLALWGQRASSLAYRWGVLDFDVSALNIMILPCLALPCLALPCLALPCLALPCLALPCLALPCLALPCLA